MMAQTVRIPLLALVVAAALWGLATSATKYALDGFAPVTLLAVELVAATIALWIVLLTRGYRPPQSWRLALTLGILEPALAYLGATLGLARTSAANGSLILGLESVFVVLLACIFLREPVKRAVLVAVAAAVLGLAAVEGSTALMAPRFGDILVMAGSLCAAAYTIVVRGHADADPLALTAHQFAFASLAIVPVACTTWVVGAEPLPTHVSLQFWTVAALVGIGGYGLSFILYNYAITSIRVVPASVIINLIPAFGLVSAVSWLGETITVERLAGAGLITASAAMASWSELG